MAKKSSKSKAQVQNAEIGEALSRTEQYIENNKTLIAIVTAVIIALIVGIWAASNFYFKPRQVKALEALVPGEKLFQAGNYQAALDGDNYDYEGFDAVIKQFKCTKAANLARAYAGLSHAQLGQFTEAIPYLQKFKGKDHMIAPSVLAALGNCYAQQEDYSKAAATLVKAAKKADNNLLSPAYLVQAGQLYEQLGDKATALKLYQQVKDKYYQSTQASDIEKYIERVK